MVSASIGNHSLVHYFIRSCKAQNFKTSMISTIIIFELSCEEFSLFSYLVTLKYCTIYLAYILMVLMSLILIYLCGCLINSSNFKIIFPIVQRKWFIWQPKGVAFTDIIKNTFCFYLISCFIAP
jgi:hypothetical protein